MLIQTLRVLQVMRDSRVGRDVSLCLVCTDVEVSRLAPHVSVLHMVRWLSCARQQTPTSVQGREIVACASENGPHARE